MTITYENKSYKVAEQPEPIVKNTLVYDIIEKQVVIAQDDYVSLVGLTARNMVEINDL